MLYLIHLEPKLKHAGHYLGYTGESRLSERLSEHARGRGARLIKAALNAGSKLYLARTWPNGTLDLESKLKRQQHFKLLCPLCCEILRPMMSDVFLIDPARPSEPPLHAVLDWQTADLNRLRKMHDRKTPSPHEALAEVYARGLKPAEPDP
jgi:hypothetical protein